MSDLISIYTVFCSSICLHPNVLNPENTDRYSDLSGLQLRMLDDSTLIYYALHAFIKYSLSGNNFFFLYYGANNILSDLPVKNHVEISCYSPDCVHIV